MRNDFHSLLAALRGTLVYVSGATGPDWRRTEARTGSAQLIFANGTKFRTDYWRVKRSGGRAINFRFGNEPLSNFDHGQRDNGAVIDAIQQLHKLLDGKAVLSMQMDEATGDLLFDFGGGTEFQAFNFTDSEVWEFIFPDGSREYSNYVFE